MWVHSLSSCLSIVVAPLIGKRVTPSVTDLSEDCRSFSAKLRVTGKRLCNCARVMLFCVGAIVYAWAYVWYLQKLLVYSTVAIWNKTFNRCPSLTVTDCSRESSKGDLSLLWPYRVMHSQGLLQKTQPIRHSRQGDQESLPQFPGCEFNNDVMLVIFAILIWRKGEF